MAEDLRALLAKALDLHTEDPSGTGGLWVYGTLDNVLKSLIPALGEPETQWSTISNGTRFPALEHTARYRARHPDHQLESRDVVVIRDWHVPDNEEN